jgi:S-DNA-T family DNA segregation ATPase FtsK/SpoIIIE
MKDTLTNTLNDFGIQVIVCKVNEGYQLHRFNCHIENDKGVDDVAALEPELSLALRARNVIVRRIDANNPESKDFYVDVPLEKREKAHLSDLGDRSVSDEAKTLVPIGATIEREPLSIDLKESPGILVAGMTGSGKSMLSHVAINTLALRNTPTKMQLLLIDPKRIELSIYNSLPHSIRPVIFSAQKSKEALEWVEEEIARRKQMIQESGATDFGTYNESYSDSRLPFIFIAIDEFNDLMQHDPEFFERSVLHILENAQAAGISLWLATSRPSTNVYPKSIVEAMDIRIAGALASEADSVTVFGRAGAEKLTGCGDLYLQKENQGELQRLQGYFISEEELAENINNLGGTVTISS